MKRGHLLLILLIIPSVLAIGVSPSSKDITFKPNLEVDLPFNFFPTNENTNTALTLSGDLVPYTTLDKTFIEGPGTVILTLKLPQTLESGKHVVNLHGSEQFQNEGGIQAGSGVTVPIRVFVPYEGKYIQVDMQISNINLNDEGTITINVKNIGSEKIEELQAKITLFSNNEPVKQLQTDKTSLNQDQTTALNAKFATSDLHEGLYTAKATISFDGQQETLEKDFIIGDLVVNILNYTEKVPEHKISKFHITYQSKWNNPIQEVFTDIEISQNNQLLLETKTPTTALKKREIKQIETFLDLSDVSIGEYDIKFTLNYRGQQSVSLRESRKITSSEKRIGIFINHINRNFNSYIIINPNTMVYNNKKET